MSRQPFPFRRQLLLGAVATLSTIACRTGPPRRGKKIRFTPTELGSGFKAVERTPASLEILADDAAYRAAAQRDQLAYRVPGEKVPVVDFEKNVVILLERGDEGGFDVRPTVKSVTRRGNVLTVDTAFEVLPEAQGLDVMARPYLYFTLPREAVAGDPELALIVDGHRV